MFEENNGVTLYISSQDRKDCTYRIDQIPFGMRPNLLVIHGQIPDK